MAANGGGELTLRAWAAEAEAAANIAKALAPTPFVPEALRRYSNPDERDPRKRILDYEATVATVAAVLLAGQELELKPMASLRAITIIKGTVALFAITARALLLQRGHDIVVVETTAQRAVVRGRRLGSEHWQQSTWDLDRARTAGLYPGAERSNWRTQPKAMLVARATAEAARWVAADAMLALPMMAEELDDSPDGQVIPGMIEAAEPASDGQAPAEKPKATRQRKTAVPRAALPSAPPPPEPGPPVAEPPPVTPAAEEPAETRSTKPQLTKLHAGLREIGVFDREGGLALVSGWAGRTVNSTGDLSRAEMSLVLERLDAVLNIAARQDQQAAQDAAGEPDPPPPDEGDPP